MILISFVRYISKKNYTLILNRIMKLLCALVFTFIASGSCQYFDENPSEPAAIVGGGYTKIQDAPYQASVLVYGSVSCGAAIISKHWLVSAAHCFIEVPHSTVTIRTGSTYTYTGGLVSRVKLIIPHPRFNERTTENDIALIKLATPLKFDDRQKAIDLPTATDIIATGDKAKISGFGKERTSDTRGSQMLKLANVPVVDQAKCRKSYVAINRVTENMFCAGNGLADSCQGDSGGPAVINGKLAGVVSFGLNCASPSYPGVYTKVSKYIDWIRKYTAADHD